MRRRLLLGLTAALSLLSSSVLTIVLGWKRVAQLPRSWPWAPHADWVAQLAPVSALLGLLTGLIFACSYRAGGAGTQPGSLDGANLLSRLSFWWVTPTLATALNKGSLDLNDLPPLPSADHPGILSRRFQRAWARGRRGPYRLLLVGSYVIQRAVLAQSLLAGWIFLAASAWTGLQPHPDN